MKKILLLLVTALTFALVSCAPSALSGAAGAALPGAVTAIQNDAATLTLDGLSTVVITNPGPDALTGDPTRPGDGVSIVVTGTAALQPVGESVAVCDRLTDRRYACHLLTVPTGAPLRLAFSAPVRDAVLQGYRPSRGATPITLFLKR